MKTINKKHLIIFILLFAIPLLADAAAIFYLPDKIPMHFGVNGEPDRYGSKSEIFIFPLFSLLIGISAFIIGRVSSKNESSTKNNENLSLISGECTLGILAAINLYFLYISLNGITNIYQPKIDIGSLISILFGIMLIILGNIMPKAKMNSYFGFRCSWTRKNEEVWKKSQHFAGITSISTGIVLFIIGFLLKNTYSLIFLFTLIAIMTAVELVYAYKISHFED